MKEEAAVVTNSWVGCCQGRGRRRRKRRVMGSSGIMVLKSIIDRCYIVHHHHEFVPSTSYLFGVAAAWCHSQIAFPFVEVAPNFFDKRSTKRRRCEQILSCETEKRWLPWNGQTWTMSPGVFLDGRFSKDLQQQQMYPLELLRG